MRPFDASRRGAATVSVLWRIAAALFVVLM